VRGYISVVLGCPFEGEVDPIVVAEISERLFQMGCYEVSLGDTIGVGTPGKTRRMIETVTRRTPIEKLGGHFRDPLRPGSGEYSYKLGMEWRPSTVLWRAWAVGRTHRVRQATLRPRRAVHAGWIEHGPGVDMDKLLQAGQFICGQLRRPTASRAGRALAADAAPRAVETNSKEAA
jgi:hydroxymethylglutaryl-CoA lyase